MGLRGKKNTLKSESVQLERTQNVDSWKQRQERDSNRSCWFSEMLKYPEEEKDFCTCRNVPSSIRLSQQLRSSTMKHISTHENTWGGGNGSSTLSIFRNQNHIQIVVKY